MPTEPVLKVLWHMIAHGLVYRLIFLVANKADIHRENTELATPLHFASTHGNLLAAQYLVELGADINKKDKSGATPLHYACAGTNADTVSNISM